MSVRRLGPRGLVISPLRPPARRRVRRALGGRRSVTAEIARRAPEGREETLPWGHLGRAFLPTRSGRQRWVTTAEGISQLAQAGSVTFLHAQEWDTISAADSVAGRLWIFLETESLREPRRYSLFAGPPRAAARSGTSRSSPTCRLENRSDHRHGRRPCTWGRLGLDDRPWCGSRSGAERGRVAEASLYLHSFPWRRDPDR